MIRACMIDGFGWFRDADYRRAWLLFDDVHYVFPREVQGPLWYPTRVFERPEYRAAPTAVQDATTQIDRWLALDLADETLGALAAGVPASDAEYARQVVGTDPELSRLLSRGAPRDPLAPISILASKLLLYGARSGALPIVGRHYASQILQRKIELAREEVAAGPTSPLSTLGKQLAFTAFGAGLSLSFVSDDDLAALPFERLVDFKRGNADLLERHRHALLEIAERSSSEAGGPDFEHELRLLRLEAQRKRRELDDALGDAWHAAGLSLLKKGLSSKFASLAMLPALIASFPSSTVTQLAIACAPAAAALVSEALDLISERRKRQRTDMMYLFEANRLLRPESAG